MRKVAYAYASGQIRISEKCPKNALPIASAEEKSLREAIGGLSRRGYKRGVHLVPGIPESNNQAEAMTALIKFSEHVISYLARA